MGNIIFIAEGAITMSNEIKMKLQVEPRDVEVPLNEKEMTLKFYDTMLQDIIQVNGHFRLDKGLRGEIQGAFVPDSDYQFLNLNEMAIVGMKPLHMDADAEMNRISASFPERNISFLPLTWDKPDILKIHEMEMEEVER